MRRNGGRLGTLRREMERRFERVERRVGHLEKEVKHLGRDVRGLHKTTRGLFDYVEHLDGEFQRHRHDRSVHVVAGR